MLDLDIAIVGAGSAGLTLALLLSELPLKIAVLDKGDAPVAGAAPSLQRVSALNQASRRVLQQLGAWQQLSSKAGFQKMEVWEADSFARIAFDAAGQQVDALGYLVDNEELRQCLFQQLADKANVRCLFNCQIDSINAGEEQTLLSLSGQGPVLCKLLVAADGANSFVRQQLKMPIAFWDYDHQALVCQIHSTEPHGQCARQVFLKDGPLALLPLADSHLLSIVWSVPPEQAEQLLALSEAEFNKALTVASGNALGVLSRASVLSAHPLKMRYASEWLLNKVVLVADAAHTIHPLAGQGMNLGLMDVVALAELISEQVLARKPLQEERLLRRFERWRKAEAQTLIVAMEAFKRGFGSANPALKLVRGLGMRLVDKAGPLKKSIMAAALGNSGDLPKRARPEFTPD
ncbi:FAD-dependent monooxygenase [Rheinheimera sp.]|uniref:FAD-dependent monooxygenase n=1 Tax=Rheinheimera sp. TaxID=1869214 RepID=UPI003AF427C8